MCDDENGRRGRLEGVDARRGGVAGVTARVPLGEMFGYASEMRSMTHGRGTFSMQFDRYQPVPSKVAAELGAAEVPV